MFFHKRSIAVLTTLVTIAACSIASAATFGTGALIPPHALANTQFFYGYDGATHKWISTVWIFDGHAWKKKSGRAGYGGIIVHNGTATIHLSRGEKLLDAHADYGDNRPRYVSLRVAANKPLPSSMVLTIGLTDVSALVYNPYLPEPPAKGTGK